MSQCQHCDQPCAEGDSYCCHGCEAAATLLEENGPFSAFAKKGEAGEHQLTLSVEGIHCASCIQLIENALLSEDAVTAARVNMSTKRLSFSWNGSAALADRLSHKVEKLGYSVKPFQPKSVRAVNAEEKFLLRCMAVAGFAMGNIMLLSVTLWSSSAEVMGFATRELMHWVSALIAFPAIAYAGRPFFRSAFSVLRNAHTNMDVPISLAVCLASFMSLWEVMRGGEHIYFDSAIMLLFFLLIGRYLDIRAKGKARESAEGLLAMLEGSATVLEGEKTRSLPISELRAGMIVLVAMGEKVPADSIIQKGESALDTSLITGETVPRDVTPGDAIFAGTINLNAPLTIEVSKASEESLLSDIVKLMEQAEQGQARYVRLADRAAKLYTPVVHSLGLLTFLGWWLLMSIAWQQALMIAVTVLIITCPCALGLAVPVVQVLASGKLMRKGILLKSGDALEKLAGITQIIFDKTGTLTLGKPLLHLSHGERSESAQRDTGEGNEQESTHPHPKSEISTSPSGRGLKIAASLAAHSRHPYSKAISTAYEGPLINFETVEEIPGEGVQAFHQGKNYRLGKIECRPKDTQQTSQPQIWLAVDGETPVAFTFEDALRADASEVLERLKASGLSLTLLSGDRAETVSQVAEQTNIKDWQAALSPVDKAKIIQTRQAEGEAILMVGDGLNDAPALASATVSISPASAMDITQNTADIVFQGDLLNPVYTAWQVAKRANLLVKQNFMLAVLYNLFAIPLAVMGYVTPLVAALAMSASSLLVIANSFRLR
jgi:Cu2+-exporting ATPase